MKCPNCGALWVPGRRGMVDCPTCEPDLWAEGGLRRREAEQQDREGGAVGDRGLGREEDGTMNTEDKTTRQDPHERNQPENRRNAVAWAVGVVGLAVVVFALAIAVFAEASCHGYCMGAPADSGGDVGERATAKEVAGLGLTGGGVLGAVAVVGRFGLVAAGVVGSAGIVPGLILMGAFV